jgi:hypothetical protein
MRQLKAEEGVIEALASACGRYEVLAQLASRLATTKVQMLTQQLVQKYLHKHKYWRNQLLQAQALQAPDYSSLSPQQVRATTLGTPLYLFYIFFHFFFRAELVCI